MAFIIETDIGQRATRVKGPVQEHKRTAETHEPLAFQLHPVLINQSELVVGRTPEGEEDVILTERIRALAKLLNVAFEIGAQLDARVLGDEPTAAEAVLELLVLEYHRPRMLRIPGSC